MNDNRYLFFKSHKLITYVIFTICVLRLHAQETVQKINAKVENQSVITLIKQIEEQTGFTFYYDTNWFKTNISKTYRNIAIDEVLTDLLKNTDFNYYIDDKKNIFLTRNSFIYNTLPKDFFGEEDKGVIAAQEELETLGTAPIFNPGRKEGNAKRETVRIGKATADRSKRTVTLTGQIMDFFTKKPVSDLSVIVDEGMQGTLTNEDGGYTLNIGKGKHTVKVSGLGYKTLRGQ